MACYHGSIALVETPAGPTQIAIENVVMGLMQDSPASIAGVQQAIHPPSRAIKALFHPFTPPMLSMLLAHRPSLTLMACYQALSFQLRMSFPLTIRLQHVCTVVGTNAVRVSRVRNHTLFRKTPGTHRFPNHALARIH